MANNKGRKSERVRMREARKRRQNLISRLIWGGAGLVVVALVGYIVLTSARPQAGQEAGAVIPVTGTNHVPVGTAPGPFNSDPPAGGNHYAATLPAKFYQEADVASLPQHPEGYLVHDLEHGYVIFWYNCQNLSQSDCTSLKNSIQTVMDENGNKKVVAFPWKSIDVPLVMTSWGRLERFQSVDLGLMRAFVSKNLNQAPEPSAP